MIGPLKNRRHELFAHYVASGKTVDESYELADMDRVPFLEPDPFYVYLLVDPKTCLPIYIGKGTGDRARWHWKAYRNGRLGPGKKRDRFDLLNGVPPRIDVIASGISEPAAYRLEGALIRSIGFRRLANVMPEHITPQVQAQRLVDRMLPFDEWIERRHPTLREARIYVFVALGLEAIAQGLT